MESNNKTTTGLLSTISEPLPGFEHNRSSSGDTIISVGEDGTFTGVAHIDALDLHQLLDAPELGRDLRYRVAYFTRMRALARQQAEEKTEALIMRRYKAKSSKHFRSALQRGRGAGELQAESAVLGDMDVSEESTPVEVHQTVHDMTGESPQTTSAGTPLHQQTDGGRTQFSLDEFFGRPVIVADGKWSVGQKPIEVLSIWDLWSADPAVRAKLSNYAFFKGNLKVKISFSGTPFHYANFLASYQPYPDENTTLTAYSPIVAAHPGASTLLNVYLSQAPGAAYINVRDNEPLVIDVPFISYKAKFRLWNSSALVITNAVPFDDFVEAGDLYLSALNPIRVANEDQAADVSYNIQVWATDVQLGCVTSTNIDITAESGVLDEYTSPGPVSSIATAVAGAGSKLASVPIIGSFARATADMASKVGAAAALFGWSKPVILDKAVFVKNNPFVNGATVAGHETSFKISLDPKQELSVDQSPGGESGEDCMAIQTIAARESYVSSFVWTDTDVSLTTVLWRGFVTPTVFNAIVAGTKVLAQPTPVAFAAVPFSYWRGTMKYRFEFVCSRFHRGRALIKFEPNIAMQPLLSTAPVRLNEQNTLLVDLQQVQEVTVEVGWSANRQWCTIPNNLAIPIVSESPTSITGNPLPISAAFSYAASNGYLEVRVLNDLVVPATGADVEVNVYVSCGDLEVAVPRNTNLPVSRTYTVESSVVADSVKFNTDGVFTDDAYLDHFGEKITSFRALLKRFITAEALEAVPAVGNLAGYSRWSFPIYPAVYPQVGTVSDFDGLKKDSLFAYLRLAYLGMRGGMRHRVIPQFQADSTGNPLVIRASDYARVTLPSPTSSLIVNSGAAFVDVPAATALRQLDRFGMVSFLSGTVTYHVLSNGGIEFEAPYYSIDLFEFAFSQTQAAGGDDSLGKTPYWSKQVIASIASTANSDVTKIFAVHDVATAEDFTFLRFQGAPFIGRT